MSLSSRAQRGICSILMFAASVAGAQEPERRVDDPRAFAIEAGAGMLGSLAGIATGITRVNDCGVEDLGCLLKNVGLSGILGVVGATVGTSIAANQTGSPRSIPGAALGALVGTGAGLGVHWLLNSASDRNLGDWVVVPIFTITQGTFAAIGSRLLGGR